MNLWNLAVLLVYTTIIVSLIWARFRFFKVASQSSRIGSLFYDPAVVIQILQTYYLLFSHGEINSISAFLAITFYIFALVLFWWAVITAKHLDFAFSDNVGKIVTSGPFAWVRHPFYLSYSLIWITSTLLFNYVFLWITLTYLVAFYITSAKTEEKVISKSEYSREYREYCQFVGMFLPRITKWKR